MKERFHSFLSWIQRNERHLSAPVFVVGFLNDAFITVATPLNVAILFLAGYVLMAAVCSIGNHYLYVRRGSEDWRLRSVRTLCSFFAQFATGGLLSGCLIFYARHATLDASWPFIGMLVIIFIGNEYFRLYRDLLALRCILFFFTLYLFSIFLLPYLFHTLGGIMFLASTAFTLILFSLFLALLRLAGKERFWMSMKIVIPASLFIAGIMVGSYFTGIIPPIPLALRDVGIYQSVTRTSDTYMLQGEANTRPWWDVFKLTPEIVHITQGSPLSAYSAVFAPTAFSTSIEHQWQRYDARKHSWTTIAQISFPISGGRAEGYRGYSTIIAPTPGSYRVTILTSTKQVIGRTYFTVAYASSTPVLITQQD